MEDKPNTANLDQIIKVTNSQIEQINTERDINSRKMRSPLSCLQGYRKGSTYSIGEGELDDPIIRLALYYRHHKDRKSAPGSGIKYNGYRHNTDGVADGLIASDYEFPISVGSTKAWIELPISGIKFTLYSHLSGGYSLTGQEEDTATLAEVRKKIIDTVMDDIGDKFKRLNSGESSVAVQTINERARNFKQGLEEVYEPGLKECAEAAAKAHADTPTAISGHPSSASVSSAASQGPVTDKSGKQL